MSKKKIAWLIIILATLCLVIGISYAYWRFTISQTGLNKLTSSCLELTLINEQNAINLEKAYPITDEEGKKTTPYSFTIENTCDMFASYTITLEVTKESTLDASYVASMLNTNAIQTLNELSTTEVSDDSLYKEAYILGTGSLGNGDSEDYTLRLWMDEDVTVEDDAMNKTFEAKVVITYSPSTYSPVVNGITTLHDAILANEYQTTDVQTVINKINQKQQPDFTQSAPIIEWQENSTISSGTLSYTMPRVEDVGSGKDYAANLTKENVYVGFATSYTFNTEEGKYYLSNFVYQDPTSIDFSNQDYYICGAGTNITTDSRLSPYHTTNCTTMYKVSGYISSSSANISGSDGTSYPATRYSFTRSRTYNQVELESDKSDKGLYAMADADGTSYYYRGSVKNNYVQFAGYYWRVIRINGDGSIRLLYSGTTPTAAGNAVQIGTSTFNSQSNLPLYVGYMYGNPSGTTLKEVNANMNDSTIKSYLDNWYSTNLSDYSEYIADSGFCNDRTLSTRSNNGNGVQIDKTTIYASYDRYYADYNPILICPDANNDLFTLRGNTKGNESLTYPIGLITIDELMLAGARHDMMNTSFYPFSTFNFWTMSATYFNLDIASAVEFLSSNDGIVRAHPTLNSHGVRPVINLNANVEITGGIGTQNEPFIVKTT